MSTRDQPLTIGNFLGINRRDGADLVQNNEFYKLQNVYPKTKALFYKREGSTQDLSSSDLDAVSSIINIHRYLNYFGQKENLYYCESASSTAIANATTAPTLSEQTGSYSSYLTNSAAYNVKYSWVGRGGETTLSSAAAITLSAGGKVIRVSVPAFPTGVRSANIFIQYTGHGLDYILVGTITSSGGTLDIYWASHDATANLGVQDALGTWITKLSGNEFGTGSLKAGTYYLSACWWSDGDNYELATTAPGAYPWTDTYIKITVPEDGKSIRVGMYIGGGTSTTGASFIAYFIGTRPPTEGPMTFVGVRKVRSAITTDYTQKEIIEITAIPEKTNCQTQVSHVNPSGTPINIAVFNTASAYGINTTGDSLAPNFSSNLLYREKDDGTIVEVLPSRTDITYDPSILNPFTAVKVVDAVPPSGIKLRKPFINKSTNIGRMATFQGWVYLANGSNLMLHTDGFALAEQTEAAGTVAPGIPQSVMVFKNQLVCLVSKNSYSSLSASSSLPALNQVFSSGVYVPNNWADGGTGSDLRFATVGDPFSDGVSALGIYNFNSATDGPSSFLACFKKASTWLLSNLPDSTGGVPAAANALSGRVGCLAPSSVVATRIGLVFLGNDGDIYLVRSQGGEPAPIGNRVRPILEHLAEDDALMSRCTATYHKGFYKLSYPSSATSTTNDAQIWADLRTEQGSPITWSGPHTGIEVGPQIVYLLGEDEDQRLCVVDGQVKTAFLDDPDTFQDLGSDMTSVIEWKTSRMGSALNLKKYSAMLLDLYYDTQYAHDIMLEMFADDQYSQQTRQLSNGTAIWGTGSFDAANWGDAQFFPVTFMPGPTNLIGRTFKWKLTHASNAQMILANAVIMYQPERRVII